jgi:hypothetical protein
MIKTLRSREIQVMAVVKEKGIGLKMAKVQEL